MYQKEIVNLYSEKSRPPRVFDVIVDEGRVDLEIKISKDNYERIPWDDVVRQVNIAKEKENRSYRK